MLCATINTRIDQAYLEFYKRHKDGTPISSEPERQRLIQCLQAAVERRSFEARVIHGRKARSSSRAVNSKHAGTRMSGFRQEKLLG
ncbi:ACT domain-containing protein ACR8 [Trifolium repens]|nr:ACT domain-containing protein ACR8 [Trifolium repens]